LTFGTGRPEKELRQDKVVGLGSPTVVNGVDVTPLRYPGRRRRQIAHWRTRSAA